MRTAEEMVLAVHNRVDALERRQETQSQEADARYSQPF